MKYLSGIGSGKKISNTFRNSFVYTFQYCRNVFRLSNETMNGEIFTELKVSATCISVISYYTYLLAYFIVS